ncbi:hypothetical protein [Rhodospirillaceae bacterium SYSU D60014]|uniref:hypothetical protein n=1 Tax=Virgifigura deserti TaxID=2268457 RepID=UPI000E662B3B
MRVLAGALILTLGTIVGASAQDLKPIHAHSIDLGSVRGTAYYTVESDGYRVVATFAADEAAAPIRVVTTLAPDQRMTIVVPRELEQSEAFIDIVRHGDGISIEQPILASN